MIELINAINVARIENYRPALKQDGRLMSMANDWSIHQDEVFHSMSHDHFQERLWSALLGAFAGGECVAQGDVTPEQVVEMWMEDEQHRVIVLGDFDSVGVGRSGKFWTADFANLEG